MSRPLNECLDCGATWRPRDRRVSRYCPDCGGDDVAVAKQPGDDFAAVVFRKTISLAVGLASLAVTTFVCCGCLGSIVTPNHTSTPPEKQQAAAEPPKPALAGSVRVVSRASFGDGWPLTVESGVLERSGDAVLFHHGGVTYGLNGYARDQGFPAADPIRARGANLSPLIQAGLTLGR